MYKRAEGFIRGHQDIKLFYQSWTKPSAKGHIIITHGQGEHSECYLRLTDYFSRDLWNFYAWDMRGHGRSEGRRGFASEFEDYCRDYIKFIKFILNEPPLQKGPVIFLAHSMGALVQIKSLIDHPQIIPQAIVMSAPLFGVAVQVPMYKEYGAVVLNRLVPQITLGNEIDNHFLTRDPDIIREFEQDILRHRRMSPGVYLGMKESFKYVMERAKKIRYPTLVQMSATDEVVSYSEAKKFFESMGSPVKKLITYEDDAKHELYNDIIRSKVFGDLKDFMDTFV